MSLGIILNSVVWEWWDQCRRTCLLPAAAHWGGPVHLLKVMPLGIAVYFAFCCGTVMLRVSFYIGNYDASIWKYVGNSRSG